MYCSHIKILLKTPAINKKTYQRNEWTNLPSAKLSLSQLILVRSQIISLFAQFFFILQLQDSAKKLNYCKCKFEMSYLLKLNSESPIFLYKIDTLNFVLKNRTFRIYMCNHLLFCKIPDKIYELKSICFLFRITKNYLLKLVLIVFYSNLFWRKIYSSVRFTLIAVNIPKCFYQLKITQLYMHMKFILIRLLHVNLLTFSFALINIF